MLGNSRETITYSKATIVSVFLLLCTITAYLYFLNMSVVQVVMRTEQTQQQRDLTIEIATLESRYIAVQHLITSRISEVNNFTATTGKIFVERDGARFVLRDN
ncbi:hypothetical protein GW766_02725 [Candidatus Parcubacteria bacterium]|nr:hypothetical protein [Candidatus Parcubacteria bacterium]